MDKEWANREVNERMALRGLTIHDALATAEGARQYRQIVEDITVDAVTAMVLYGHAPGFGTIDELSDRASAADPEL